LPSGTLVDRSIHPPKTRHCNPQEDVVAVALTPAPGQSALDALALFDFGALYASEFEIWDIVFAGMGICSTRVLHMLLLFCSALIEICNGCRLCTCQLRGPSPRLELSSLELVRQSHVECIERGILLERVRDRSGKSWLVRELDIIYLGQLLHSYMTVLKSQHGLSGLYHSIMITLCPYRYCRFFASVGSVFDRVQVPRCT
jgi:hypothetical protein